MEPLENIPVVSIDIILGEKWQCVHLLEQGFKILDTSQVRRIGGSPVSALAAWRDALREAGLQSSDQHWGGGKLGPLLAYPSD